MSNHPAEDQFPRWSSDGRFIYFCSKRTGRFEIWRTPSGGGEPVQMTENGGWFSSESPDGQDLFFTRWREPGVWRKSLADGSVTRIIDEPVDRLAVDADGIYFMTSLGQKHEGLLKYLHLSSGALTTVYSNEKRLAGGWSVSSGGTRLALSQYDLDGADIILIDAFSCRKLALEFSPGPLSSNRAVFSSDWIPAGLPTGHRGVRRCGSRNVSWSVAS